MDDLISRKWLMECINEGWIKFDTEKDKNKFIHLVRDIAPSADTEPERHGHWVYGEDEDGVDGYRCNKCGFFVTWDYQHSHIHFIDDYFFCPHCKARMDEDG